MSIEGLLRTLDKAHSGPVCTVKEWNMKVIPRLTQQKLKEHGLQKTFDSNNPINTDDGLADEFYKAGFELAIEMGVICQETERVIKVSEEELLEGIRSAPSELVLGYGEDRVVVRPRRPEDKLKPLMIAPTAVAFSEDMYIKFTQAVAQYREIDIMEGFDRGTRSRRFHCSKPGVKSNRVEIFFRGNISEHKSEAIPPW